METGKFRVTARHARGVGSAVAGLEARERQTKEHSLLPAWMRCQSPTLEEHSPVWGRTYSQMDGWLKGNWEADFIYLFIQQILNTCCVPDIIAGTGDTERKY